MSESKDLVFIPTAQDWKFFLEWGAQAIRSKMLPSAIQTPEQAAIVILKGRELGLSFMTAIAHIHVVNGKPSMSAELMQSMARKNIPGLLINILESTDKKATVEFVRPEKGAKPLSQSFTMEEAHAAKLTGKDVWKSYPAAMLFSRAMTAGLRKVCPEALMGISYTPEELGAEVDADGNVIETTGKAVEPKVDLPRPKEPDVDYWMMSGLQLNQIKDLCEKIGWSGTDLIHHVKTVTHKRSLDKLTQGEYEDLMDHLHQKVKEKENA